MKKLLSAIVLLGLVVLPSVLVADETTAAAWLERMARFYERAPFVLDYSMLRQADHEGQTSIFSAEGAITHGDETHMRVAMSMTVLASGQASRTATILMVADGEAVWIEIESPTDGVQVEKMSLDQFDQALGGAGPGGLAPEDPLAQLRRLQELLDFEVAEEGAERVVLRAPVSERFRQELGPQAEFLGPEASAVIALDPETGAPLSLEIGGKGLRTQISFANLRFLDAAVLSDGTFAYRPPEGSNIVQQPDAQTMEPETMRYVGYIDTTGAVVIEPAYSFSSDFSEDLASVEIPGTFRSGAIDRAGKMVIEPRFRRLGRFSEGLAPASLPAQNSGYVDASGEWVIEPRFYTAEPFSEGLALVTVEGGYAWIDPTGEIVIAPRPYRLAESFVGGVAAVQDDDKAWGLIDRTGKLVAEPQFRRIRDAAEGLVAVQKGDAWGFVDVEGRMAVEPRHDAVIDFGEGLAPVGRRGRGWSYIDRSGKVVIEGPFEMAIPFSEGLGAVKLSGSWGFVDPEGRFVIEPRFTEVASFTEGLAAVELNGKIGYIDKSGEVVIEPRFEDAEPFSDGLASFGVTVPLSPRHSEVLRETRWADQELLRLAHRESHRQDLERDAVRFDEMLVSFESLLPEAAEPLEIPSLRTCQRASDEPGQSSPLPVERRAVDVLETLCDEVDARADLRRLEARVEATQSYVVSIRELLEETGRE